MSVRVHIHVSRARTQLLGSVLIAGIGRRVVRIQLDDDEARLQGELLRDYPHGIIKKGSSTTQEAAREIRGYLEGGRDPEFEIVIPEGSFDSRIWRYLARIPRGQVRTYGAVARAVRRPSAARAVGQACGRNPLPLILPCHRVVAAGLKLGGFGGGPEKKMRLLELEGAHVKA